MKSTLSLIKAFIFIILFFSFLNSTAQNKKILKSIEKEAILNYEVDEYKEALPLYLKLDSIKPNVPHVTARIGICYLHTEFKWKALPYLEEAKQAGYSKDYIDYFIGHAYHLDHQFDKAIASFELSKSQQILKRLKTRKG